MDKICCIVDFQGFKVNRKFLVREFGWINMETGETGIYKFSLPLRDISSKDRSTISYNENNFHGLSYGPASGDGAIDIKHLDSKVMEVHNKCKRGDVDIVAFKGLEKKDILTRLKIPFRNLEEFGCPKYDNLKKYHKPNSCGFHKNNLPCSVSVVDAYRSWIRDNISEIMERRNAVDDDDDDYYESSSSEDNNEE